MWEYSTQTLEDQISERDLQKRKFQQEELFSIIASVIEGMSCLQFQGIKHESLTTTSILISQKGAIKVADPLTQINPINFDRCKTNRRIKKVYLSPQQCQSLKNMRPIPNRNTYKSDVFVFGVILLECGLLERMDSVFVDDFERIEFEQVRNRLNKFQEAYGKGLRLTVESMLHPFANERMDWMSLRPYLSTNGQRFGQQQHQQQNSPNQFTEWNQQQPQPRQTTPHASARNTSNFYNNNNNNPNPILQSQQQQAPPPNQLWQANPNLYIPQPQVTLGGDGRSSSVGSKSYRNNSVDGSNNNSISGKGGRKDIIYRLDNPQNGYHNTNANFNNNPSHYNIQQQEATFKQYESNSNNSSLPSNPFPHGYSSPLPSSYSPFKQPQPQQQGCHPPLVFNFNPDPSTNHISLPQPQVKSQSRNPSPSPRSFTPSASHRNEPSSSLCPAFALNKPVNNDGNAGSNKTSNCNANTFSNTTFNPNTNDTINRNNKNGNPNPNPILNDNPSTNTNSYNPALTTLSTYKQQKPQYSDCSSPYNHYKQNNNSDINGDHNNYNKSNNPNPNPNNNNNNSPSHSPFSLHSTYEQSSYQHPSQHKLSSIQQHLMTAINNANNSTQSSKTNYLGKMYNANTTGINNYQLQQLLQQHTTQNNSGQFNYTFCAPVSNNTNTINSPNHNPNSFNNNTNPSSYNHNTNINPPLNPDTPNPATNLPTTISQKSQCSPLSGKIGKDVKSIMYSGQSQLQIGSQQNRESNEVTSNSPPFQLYQHSGHDDSHSYNSSIGAKATISQYIQPNNGAGRGSEGIGDGNKGNSNEYQHEQQPCQKHKQFSKQFSQFPIRQIESISPGKQQHESDCWQRSQPQNGNLQSQQRQQNQLQEHHQLQNTYKPIISTGNYPHGEFMTDQQQQQLRNAARGGSDSGRCDNEYSTNKVQGGNASNQQRQFQPNQYTLTSHPSQLNNNYSNNRNQNNFGTYPEPQLEDLQVAVQHFHQGSKYQGTKYKGLRHGLGKFYYQDGGMYEGSWRFNRMDGYGKLYYQSGKIAYQGQWKDDQFHGWGKLYNEEPEPLNQQFDYENFDSIQEFWTYYEGQFFNDEKDGKGKMVLSNGDCFEGIFRGDLVHGAGVFYQNNGEKIEGVWEQNKMIEIQ